MTSDRSHWVLNYTTLLFIIRVVEFQKITLVGVGLLGGSIGLAVKRRGLAGCVAGLVRREESIAECTGAGVVDMATLDPAEAVGDAALVILCTQVGQMGELAQQLKPHLADDAIVTDVGSAKADGLVVPTEYNLADSYGGPQTTTYTTTSQTLQF